MVRRWRPWYSKLIIYPVSYTHLDVYKRQALDGLWGGSLFSLLLGPPSYILWSVVLLLKFALADWEEICWEMSKFLLLSYCSYDPSIYSQPLIWMISPIFAVVFRHSVAFCACFLNSNKKSLTFSKILVLVYSEAGCYFLVLK